ncbi:MAG: carbon storage regulator [Deltaproteobacteria bacterium]|nr:MAG: carbon storage regulator [Deltaproteobacteria bacterium]
MLVLTRKEGQVITIGENIRIKVVEISGNSVKLGIEAPRDMPIYREELYEKLKQLNVEAAKLPLDRIKEFFGIDEE